MQTIIVSDICKKYGRTTILDQISFTASSGECIGIVGPNGCGKSTLLKILANTLKPSSGSVTCDGEVGYVPQENPLFASLSVYDNLKLWYCDSKRNLSEDIEYGLINDFGLSKYLRYKVSKLSGGMRKRLSIVCAIANDPRIIILDEPGASLDLVCKQDICKYIKNFINDGGTVILASHEESELATCTTKYMIEGTHLTRIPNTISASELAERIANV